jgi:transposase-like protein
MWDSLLVCASVPDLARRHGVAETTIYRWKSKSGGMDVSDAKKLRALEQENRKLKRLLAEAELDSWYQENGNGLAATSGAMMRTDYSGNV